MNLPWVITCACAATFVGLMVWLFATQQLTPDCQTFWDAQYTGVQTIAGHRVECFHGNVVKVGR